MNPQFFPKHQQILMGKTNQQKKTVENQNPSQSMLGFPMSFSVATKSLRVVLRISVALALSAVAVSMSEACPAISSVRPWEKRGWTSKGGKQPKGGWKHLQKPPKKGHLYRQCHEQSLFRSTKNMCTTWRLGMNKNLKVKALNK